MKPIASNGRNQTLGPHPEEAAHRSRACPTSATLKCRNRQQPISMAVVAKDGRLPGLACCHPSRRAQERAPQDEVLSFLHTPLAGNDIRGAKYWEQITQCVPNNLK